jgi:CBS domain-containing protein
VWQAPKEHEVVSEDQRPYGPTPDQVSSGIDSYLSYYDLRARNRGRERMQQVAKDLSGMAEPYETTPRKILDMFGYKKRGHRVRAIIRSVIDEAGLTVLPALNAVSLDDRVFLSPKVGVDMTAGVVREVLPAPGYDYGSNESSRGGEPEDVVARVGALPTARLGVTSVSSRDRLDLAVAKMALSDYSQLPVLAGDRAEGVISWKCLGLEMARGGKFSGSEEVRRFMRESVTVCRGDDALLDVIRDVIREEFVLVRDERSGQICGIVTTMDLAEFLQDTYQAFALISEIEALIRQFLNRKFQPDDFVAAKNPADESRKVNSAEDLTFGEYRRLLENKERWSRLEMRLDRKVFLHHLEQVTSIRNGVMHFAEDSVSDDDVRELQKFLAAMRRLLV